MRSARATRSRCPGLEQADSRMAVPAVALGQVVGVLAVDSVESEAYGPAEESALTVVASLLAGAIETIRAEERVAEATGGAVRPVPPRRPKARTTHVRFFEVDGSTFLDGDYLIKGVAGRILWSLLGQYDREGRVDFTNREVRLDPDPRPARLQGQLREPAHPPEAPPRRARRADPHREDRSRPLPPRRPRTPSASRRCRRADPELIP